MQGVSVEEAVTKAIHRGTVIVDKSKVAYIRAPPGKCVFIKTDDCVYVATHDTVHTLLVNINGGFDKISDMSTNNHYMSLTAFCSEMDLGIQPVTRMELNADYQLNGNLGVSRSHMAVFTVSETSETLGTQVRYVVTGYSGDTGVFQYTGATYIDSRHNPCPLFTDIEELKAYIRNHNTLG